MLVYCINGFAFRNRLRRSHWHSRASRFRWLHHNAVDSEHRFGRIRVIRLDDDNFGKRAGLARVVLHLDASAGLGRDGFPRPFGHHAAARRERRGDEQRRVALVGEAEHVLRVAVLHDGVEVEHRFLKGDFGRGGFLSQHLKCGGKDYRCYDDEFLHGLLVLVLFLVVGFGFEEFGVVAQIACFINDLLVGRDEVVIA